MRRASAVLVLILAFLAGARTPLRGQISSGSIQGTVTDDSGRPLAGAAVYLSSPAMLGQRIILTGESGGFDFPSLASGEYALAAEMPGFITLLREQICLRSGMSVFVRIKLAASEQESEVRTEKSLSSLDTVSSKASLVQERAMVRHLPLARDFDAILTTVPGVATPGYPYPQEAAISGGTVRDNVYSLDGANLTDPFSAAPLVSLNVDLVDEIEVVSSGQPASLLPARGATINVISKSGGNAFAGELGLYLVSNALNKNLWTASQADDWGVPQPGGDKNLFEASLNLGGTFWVDRAWYFGAARFLKKSREGIFVGPFRDAEGGLHENYDWSRRDFSGFFKLTVRPIAGATFTAWGNLANVYQPVAEDPSPRLPFLSTHILDHEKTLSLFGAAEYQLNQNTLASARGAYLKRDIPTYLQTDALALAWTEDAGDLYGPLSGADYNADAARERLQANASIRKFADNLLGISQTLSAGVDFDYSASSLSWWRQDNLLRHFDSRNPNMNYFGDCGLLGLWICGPIPGSTLVESRTQGLGAYAADSFTVARRLTFSLGLRFDWTWGWLPAGSKLESGNPLSLYIGDALVSPRLKALWPDYFPAAFNPWDAFAYTELSDVISWKALSPHAGLAFDIWGNGKTVLRASYARAAEALSHRYFQPLHPFYPRSLDLTWMDANGDGRPDVEDEFGLLNLDYRYLSGDFVKKRVADGIKAPSTEGISLGLEHELFREFTLGLRFVSRVQKNIVEDVLYAPETGEYWYAPEQAAAQKYWIPFTTTVPGTGDFPSETVTLYVKSLEAPPVFLQLRNVPELERKYRAAEFTFAKRLSHGWQLAGSLVLSKAEGNIDGFSEATTGLTAAGDSPDYFVNRAGRLDTDRPLRINLMGSVELPFGAVLSGFFSYQSGRPWQRWVQILPPAAWCSAHNAERTYYAVNLEAPGSRREKAWSTLDLRLEKDWRLGSRGRLGLYADVANLLGYKASLVGLNDIDRWLPAAEGAGQAGQKYLSPDYGVTSALYGQRTFRFGLRLDF